MPSKIAVGIPVRSSTGDRGLATAIAECRREGKSVIGICGGYQMMGLEVSDPQGVEGEISRLPGLGLLPVRTVLEGEKVTRQVKFRFMEGDTECTGYEIHMGRTTGVDDAQPLNRIDGAGEDGCYVDDRCFGTYIHGVLDNPTVIEHLLAPYIGKTEVSTFDYKAYKEEQYDALAAHMREHIDIPLLYKIMGAE